MKLLSIFISTFLFNVSLVSSANNISASGGGIVAKGQDLILTYSVGADDQGWITCKWGRYEPSENSDEPTFEYCMFADLTGSGNVTELNCKPADFMETNQIEYIGTTKSECKIKVGNTDMDDSVTWNVALDSDVEPKTINVTIATPLDNATQILDPESVEAGVENVVSCAFVGGEPVPEITVLFGAVDDNSNLTVNDSSRVQQTIKREDGKFIYVYNTTIIPQIKDHGRTIDCVAIQYDKMEPKQILFKDTQGTNGSLNANRLTLNVQFPPQPLMKNETFDFTKNTEATISLMIKANPKPTNLTWVVRNQNATNGNETETWTEVTKAIDISLPTTENKTRYVLSNLTDTADSTMFLANLTIKDVTNSDHLKDHYLIVKNDKGQQSYYFYINVTDFTPPPTTQNPPTTQQPGGNTTAPPANTTIASNTTLSTNKTTKLDPNPTTPPAINSTQPTVNTTTVEPVPPQNTTTSKAPSTTNPSQSSGGSLSGAVIAIIVLVSLTVLVIIGFVVYKKCFKRQQTSPFYNLN